MERITEKNGEGRMTIDLDQLEALARAATHGPWDNTVGYRIYAGKKNVANAQEVFSCYAHEEIRSKQAQANAAFIVAVNPAVVLELIEELRTARLMAGYKGSTPEEQK
jgi:hypothetical protein